MHIRLIYKHATETQWVIVWRLCRKSNLRRTISDILIPKGKKKRKTDYLHLQPWFLSNSSHKEKHDVIFIKSKPDEIIFLLICSRFLSPYDIKCVYQDAVFSIWHAWDASSWIFPKQKLNKSTSLDKRSSKKKVSKRS